MNILDVRPATARRWRLHLALVAAAILSTVPAGARPGALPDTYSTPEGVTLQVGAPGLLANDGGGVNNARTFLETAPSHGVAVIGLDGSLTYTPNPGFVGVDVFTYTNRRPSGTTIAEIRITVTGGTNAPPVATDDDYSTPAGTPLVVAAPGVLDNDRDPEGHSLSYELVAGPANGTLADAADGGFRYTPAAGFDGADSFTYRATDGALFSDVATVRITVDPPPNLPPTVNDDVYSVPEDGLLHVSAPGVLDNDRDPEGHLLTAGIETQAMHGTVVLQSDGSFDYQPASGFTGDDSFTYRASDGDLTSDVATVRITVTAVNQPPIANDNTYTVPQDSLLEVDAPGLLGNDRDPEGHALTVVDATAPSSGSVTHQDDGSFSYRPSAGFVGTDSFTYTVSDGEETATATVTVTVTAVNQRPVANDDAFRTAQDTRLTVPCPGVLGNDVDPEGDTLVLRGGFPDPSHGRLNTLVCGGFTYTPDPGYTGTDSFGYAAFDGGRSTVATVTITVTPVNQPPVANDNVYTTPQDTRLVVRRPGLLDNDTDPEGHLLVVVDATQPANGYLAPSRTGAFLYRPNPGYVGSDSFEYTVSDGRNTDTATVTITVTPVNQPPVAHDNSFTIAQDTRLVVVGPGILDNDDDPEGHGLQIGSVIMQPVNGILSIQLDGGFTYTPNPGFSGSDSFEYTANDGDLDSNVATVDITVEAINQPPVANNDLYTVPQDTDLVVPGPGVLDNDDDPEGHALRISTIVDVPTNGTLTPQLLGGFSYTPAPGFVGEDSFSYRASDNALDSNIATVRIKVTAVNQPPVANDNVYSTPQDTRLVVACPGVLDNDVDPEGNSLQYRGSALDPSFSGRLSTTICGGFTYTPDPGFVGSVSFTYRATDGSLISNLATVTITVSPANQPPVANDNGYSTPQDGKLVVAAPGVLGNDSDPEGHALSFSLDTGTAFGKLSPHPDGGFLYVPDPGFTGTDSFSYRANDGDLDSNLARVTITVNAVNRPPIAKNDVFSVPQDTLLRVPDVPDQGLLANDVDPEGHDLFRQRVVSQPGHGALSAGGRGGFTYVPDAGFVGTDSFQYTATDGLLESNVATVTITVNAANRPPVAQDNGYVTPQGTNLVVAAPGVLGNDSDPEGHALGFVLDSGPANGTLSPHPDGGFTYVPDPAFNGVDSFTYRANDGDLDSNVATVFIGVTIVNQPPVAQDNTYSTPQDTPLVVTAPGVLGNDRDPEGHSLAYIFETGPANGTLSPQLDGGFTYTPAPGFTGVDSFTYRANDGGLRSDVATVTIKVDAVNLPPIAHDKVYSTPQDTALVVAAPGVLDNDTDPEGHSLGFVLDTGPANGTLSPRPDGGFTYTPAAGFSGIDSFTYRANDGSLESNVATVIVRVNAVNQPPVAQDNSYSTPQDTALVVAAPGVLGNDRDPEGHALAFIFETGPANGALTPQLDGGFTYVPAPGFTGVDSFTYRANDGGLRSDVAKVTITVNAVNQPPVANDNVYSTQQDMALSVPAPGLFGNDSDPEGHSLDFVLVSGPADGALSVHPDGSFTYVPDAGFSGSDSFSYRATDGVLESGIATVTIAVTSVNQPPVANDNAYSTPQDTVLVVAAPGVLGNDIDPEGHALELTFESGPAHGTLSPHPDGSFTYVPDFGFVGTDSFTYSANDGVLNSNVATVSITVTAVNQAPVANDDGYSTPQDVTLDVPAPGVLGNDADPERHALGFVLVAAPADGTLSPHPDGSFSYVPAPGFVGTDSFTYSANDGALGSNVATVTITVTAVNQAPIAHDDVYSTPQGTPLDVPAPGLLDNDSDPEGHALGLVLVTGPADGTLSPHPDGSFTYVPDAGFAGTDAFTYRATDGTLESDIATVSITVTAVNGRPVARDDAYSTQQDTLLLVGVPGVLGNDADPEGHALGFILETFPDHGKLAPHPDGSFLYAPRPGFSGTDSFTYRATDGVLGSNVATVTITVDAVNQPPFANGDAYATPRDVVLDVPAPGVLGNDGDPEGHALGFVLVSGPTDGTLSPHPDGSFTYVPDPGFTGTDSFRYRVTDGVNQSNVATVSLAVGVLVGGSPVNQPPVAIDDLYTISRDSRLVVERPGVLTNDIDPEGHRLGFVLDTKTSFGKLAPHPDGSFRYIPNPGFVGTDTFTYRATDGALLSNPATVTIVVEDRVTPPAACVSSATTLCLLDRFEVSVDWRTGTGDDGSGITIPRSFESGLFWFFDPDNVEIGVKVMDGCTVNDRFWVFAGGLTDVATLLTVTDTVTGVTRQYENREGRPFQPITDTDAFATCSAAGAPVRPESGSASELPSLDLRSTTCQPSSTELCLSGGRYRVSAVWETRKGDSGQAEAVALTPDTGLLQFFSPTNVELVVKVLDACSVNGNVWVFAAGLTDVEVTLTVTDTVTGVVQTYANPQNTPFQPILDTAAFQPCS